MEAITTTQFDDLIALLSKLSETRNARGNVFKSFNKSLSDLVDLNFSLEDFREFLRKLHDRLVKFDTVYRIYGFRAIRHFLKSVDHISVFIDEVTAGLAIL